GPPGVLFTAAELAEMKAVATEYTAKIRSKGPAEIAAFNADPKKYLLPHPTTGATKITIGKMVESAGAPGVRQLAADGGMVVLENLRVQFVDAVGTDIGGTQNELDFVILGSNGVQEVVTAKFNPGSVRIKRDRAILGHFYSLPTGPPADIVTYLRAILRITSQAYATAARVDVISSAGRQSLASFRASYLSKVPVSSVTITPLTPNEPGVSPTGLQLRATRAELVDQIVVLMNPPL